MQSANRIGRIIGVLLPIQLALGLILQFVLFQNPLSSEAPGFLEKAAAAATQIHVAVGLAFLGGALTLTIAVQVWPVFRRYSQPLAMAFLAACAISLLMDALQAGSVMAMLSLSERYVAAENANAELYQALAATVRSTRFWTHYVQLAFVGAWIFLFYFILFRSRLVPRWLATIGIIGVLIQFTNVTLPAFAGYTGYAPLAAILAPIQVTTGIWLMVKGFPQASSAA